MLLLGAAGAGVLQDVEPFGVRRHHAVFDRVVHHLHEVAGAVRATVEIATIGGAIVDRAPRRLGRRATPWGEGGEDCIEATHHVGFTTDHEAVAALKSPHATAHAAVDVVQSALAKRHGTRNIVLEVGVAAVEYGIALGQDGEERLDRRVHDAGRNHQPDEAWRGQGGGKRLERRGGHDLSPIGRQLRRRLGAAVIDDAPMPRRRQASHHVGAHPPESDHPYVHALLPKGLRRAPASIALLRDDL